MPDIVQSIVEQVDDPGLTAWLVNAGEDPQTAYAFINDLRVGGIPVLLDTEERYFKLYNQSVPGYAPAPLHVVIDKSGTIVYLGKQSEPDAVVAAIQAALAE